MKKTLLSIILSVVATGMACADEPIKGIIATYDGAETSYKLEDVPTVQYEEVEGVKNAVLYLKDVEKPVLKVALAEGKELVVTYGEYQIPTGINGVSADKASIVSRNGKKYIMGGKLIVIGKDGKQYDAAGVEIK